MNKLQIKLIAFFLACGMAGYGIASYFQNKSTDEEILPDTELEIVLDDNRLVHISDDTKLMSSNTLDSITIDNLEIGESAIRILSYSNNWDLVNCNGTLGYVHRDDLDYTNEFVDDGYEHRHKEDIVLTTAELNFRTAPTTESEKIDTFEKGTELQVISEVDNGWLMVSCDGKIGYVNKDYTISLLTLLKNEYPNIDMDKFSFEKLIYVSSSELNLRQGPSTDTEKLTTFEQYELLRVIKEDDEWSLVMTNDYEFGYVYNAYTKEIGEKLVDVDISNQTSTLYNSEGLMLIQTPVTTGRDSNQTDKGLHYVFAKETDRYLTGPGYSRFVKYWAPFNGYEEEGLHDAPWRDIDSFGTEIYHTNGSLGCVNTPEEAMATLFENIEVGTKVLVHK